jgi:hypothetical protein
MNGSAAAGEAEVQAFLDWLSFQVPNIRAAISLWAPRRGLTSVPAALSSVLPALTCVNLSENALTSFPTGILGCTHLQVGKKKKRKKKKEKRNSFIHSFFSF